MNKSIWEFHDWLIDQKKENKVTESDFNYIIEHIKNNYTPNVDNSYVQENILSAIETQIEEDYWANDNFWSKIVNESKGLAHSKLYKTLGKLISYFEKIENVEGNLQKQGIKILRTEINSMFGSMIHSERTSIYFSEPPLEIEDGYLIIFYTPADHDNDEYAYIFDDLFYGYGLFNGYKSMVRFIDEWNSVENTDPLFENNVKKYFKYLNNLHKAPLKVI